MKIKHLRFLLLIPLFVLFSCNKEQTAQEILNSTIASIDTIETIYFKQDMKRTNPRNVDETISRYREMYFSRLLGDSIVGLKGHWYMYIDDKENIIYEDIFDGDRLIRKNNRDSTARIYDLAKYPEFREQHFWSHNTLYGMQHSFRYMLDNRQYYIFNRLNDTVFQNTNCYQIEIILEDKSTMPGFETKLEESEGSISRTLFFINQHNFYPLKMREEFYSSENPEQKVFIDQTYHDIRYNLKIAEDIQFDTSVESISGYGITEIKPQ